MSKFPKVIFGICHGKTEGILFSEIVSRYLECKFDELGAGIWDGVNPTVKVLSNVNNGCSVTVNSFENDVKKFFISRNSGYGITEVVKGSKEILFISLIDINEWNSKHQVPERYEHLIKNGGHKEILMKLLDESNINSVNSEMLLDSLMVTFEGSVEDCLPSYQKHKNKSIGMNNWIRDKIDYNPEPSSEHIKEVFSLAKKDRTNIMEMFELIDKLFHDLKEELE